MNAFIPFAWSVGLAAILVCSSPSAAQIPTTNSNLPLALPDQTETTALNSSGNPGVMRRSHTSNLVEAVLRLVESGVDETVVRSFLKSGGAPTFNAVDIATLRAHGLSDNLIDSLGTHKDAPATNAVPISADSPEALVHSNTTVVRLETPAAVRPPQIALEASVSPDSQRLEAAYAGDLQTKLIPPAAQKSQSLPLTTTKKPLYPVREPYPVPLTDPFIVLELPSF